MALWQQKIIFVVLILCSCAGLYGGIKGFYAESSIYPWRLQLQAVTDTSLLKFSKIKQQRLEASIDLEKNNAEYWNLTGAYYWLEKKSLVDDPLKSDEASITAYLNAVALEPHSASHWLGLALVHVDIPEKSSLFCQYYTKSYELGKSLFYILESIVANGFNYWVKMNSCSRVVLKEALRSLYILNKQAAIRISEEAGYLHMACIWLMDFDDQIWQCKKELRN